jgi:GDPmannose 4,6-dehydratase
MHSMLRHEEPDDFVIGSGETHSVLEFCEKAFAEVDLDYRDYVREDERFRRPAEVDLLLGDPAKARRVLGWQPTYTFDQLISEMVHSDLEALRAPKAAAARAAYQLA